MQPEWMKHFWTSNVRLRPWKAAVEEVRRSSTPSEGIKERPIEVLEPSANTDWFGMEGDGNE